MNRLAPWNPAGGFFHAATKDVTFGERELAERMLRERASSRRIPAMVKRYPRSTRIPLPRASGSGEFVGTLLTRRTWRRFSTRKLTTGQLATLLALTGGFQQYVKGGPLGRSPQRTSPSGGARHPIEIYVLAVNVEGLPKGLYHYGSDAHVLHRIRPARAGGVQRYLPSQYWFDNAAAVVFFSGVFERTLWRYDTARAYRAVLIEAGHLCQTFCLTATWLNLAPFCSMAIADQAIETDLGLDGITESVLYAAGVGCRDGDASDSFSPRDVPPPRIEANPAFRALAPSRAGKLRGSR